MPFKIFIDTEFTDFVDIHLISIGMVAQSGEEFYAEVSFPELSCSDFVRETVIPLLGQIEGAHCSVEDLYIRITSWLKIVRPGEEEIEICFDYQSDWDLFSNALDNRAPSWCRPRHVSRNINELLRYKFHKESKLPEHHALYDARANRYAFRERRPVTT
ncbi:MULTISPECIES: 3'-5' exoribonuclease domain-containing protein [unclassified Herbaspirillum]|uniref:3'-5' exoribonuclease domain-containing protein n=1 Tax=unclassified Herbaspirillum TaxID=2624150 RepID=UPI001152D554|nr:MULTISPECIES: 3'-5' exoribonuclease [unclassified Herbaspirillum]MBB5390775.1 hypothetical protein [Herbaspirillum sp. SJZ102]TQK04067.1 uncharacterized protein DUF5051 [Herbaspirillum sp. SJZ106]TQK14657.1 uncharacterized protein DUF5051 [Herbaspirillum sp. SJZ130]